MEIYLRINKSNIIIGNYLNNNRETVRKYFDKPEKVSEDEKVRFRMVYDTLPRERRFRNLSRISFLNEYIMILEFYR